MKTCLTCGDAVDQTKEICNQCATRIEKSSKMDCVPAFNEEMEKPTAIKNLARMEKTQENKGLKVPIIATSLLVVTCVGILLAVDHWSLINRVAKEVEVEQAKLVKLKEEQTIVDKELQNIEIKNNEAKNAVASAQEATQIAQQLVSDYWDERKEKDEKLEASFKLFENRTWQAGIPYEMLLEQVEDKTDIPTWQADYHYQETKNEYKN